MKILADSVIEKNMKEGHIKIDPLPEDGNFQPNSVDLNLGKVYELENVIQSGRGFRARYEPVYGEIEPSCGRYLIKKNNLYFFETEQNLEFDNNITKVHISPRSTLARAFIETIPLSGEIEYWIQPPFKGNIFCSVISHAYDIEMQRGQKMVQAVFFSGEDRTRNMRTFHSDKFFLPRKIDGPLDLSKKIKDDIVYEEIFPNIDNIIIGQDACFRVVSEEKIDYRDGSKAAVMFQSGGVSLCVNHGLGLNDIGFQNSCCATGYALLADAGYQGNLSGFIFGNENPKIFKRGCPILIADEFEIDGEVIRLYGNKTLGSHYQK